MVHPILRDPANWALGALGSIVSVLGAILFDPTGAVAAIVATTLAQAPTLFTLSGIGLAAGGRVPTIQEWQPVLVAVWLASGAIFAAGLIDRYWDGLKERLL